MDSNKKGAAAYIAGDCAAVHDDVSDSACREGIYGVGEWVHKGFSPDAEEDLQVWPNYRG